MTRTQEYMKQRNFVCNYENCNARFYRADRLESHLFVHEGERPFVCSFVECSKSYTRRSHLKRHEATHETNFQCTVEGCEVVLKTKATLKKHVDGVHSSKNPKTYKCTVCNDSFSKHNWLRQHMYRHTGVRPYLCPVENCDKRFLVPSNLKRHMTIHEGYHCTKPECKQNFPTWSLYIKHFKVFHPVVHKCDVCDKVFSTSSYLKNHKLLHNNEREVFICPKPYCTRFYFAERNLNQHIKSYHRKRPFVCPNENCEKSFKTEEILSSHLRVHDPTKPDRKRKKKHPEPTFAEYLAGYEPGENGQSTTSGSEMENEILHKNSANNKSSNNEIYNEKVLQKELNEYNLQSSKVLESNQNHALNNKKINEYLLDDELLNQSEILSSDDLSGNESDKTVIVFNYEPAPETMQMIEIN